MVSLSICWGLLPATRGVEPRDSLKGSETSSKFNSPRPCRHVHQKRQVASQPPPARHGELAGGGDPGPGPSSQTQGYRGTCGHQQRVRTQGRATWGAGTRTDVGRDRRLQPACEERACICLTGGKPLKERQQGVKPARLRFGEYCRQTAGGAGSPGGKAGGSRPLPGPRQQP